MASELQKRLMFLTKLFPSTHERFRITRSSPEEICCTFVTPTGKVITINGTIAMPAMSVIWYTDAEDQKLAETLSTLSETCLRQNAMLVQVRKMVATLCSQYSVAPPSELSQLSCDVEKKGSSDKATEATSSECSDDLACEESTDKESPQLQKVKAAQLKVFNSPTQGTANKRLMKEFREILLSKECKQGDFKVELVDDSLFQWRIKIKKVDPDSALSKDLKTLQGKTGQDFIELNFAFNTRYPFEPPVVAVVSPRLVNGHVAGGGAICLELLTKEGWSSAYTVETILVQVISTLCGGGGRVQFDNLAPYDISTASGWMSRLQDYHKEHGWYTPPNESG